jgi:glycosyltransferase involved in cell wall biosynthesis
MKILYDHQIFASQKYGGISRYFYELAREFDGMDDVEINISLMTSNNYYISTKQYTKHFDLLSDKHFRWKQRLFNLPNKPNSIYKLKKQNFDIFHPTYYDPYFLKYLNNKPFVLTVYDMIHEKFSDMFSKGDKTTEYKKLLAQKATKIIAISQSTKEDLVELFGTDASKVEVIYLGNSMEIDEEKNFDINLPHRYILFVGSRGAYKNFNGFLSAISSLLVEDKNLHLVCVGGGSFSNSEVSQMESLKIDNQITQYSLNDDTLAYFYSRALVFVFPSLYEGFGIPILESFACNCPLICSNTSSFPEIAEDGAVYFNPYSKTSICEAIKKVAYDKVLQDKLRKKGLEQLKKFSWQQTARQTKKIYEGIAK